jgi:imidazolonepropionase-like amidohydrolase
LASIQASAKGSFLSDLAAKMTHKPDSGILIRSVKVFDSRKGSYVGPRDVQVKNDKIEIISESRLLEKRGYESIDGTGKTLLPGLWEMHGHFSRENGLFEIAAGTTNLRDMGNSPDLQTTVEEIRREKIIGPDIDIIMGLVDGPGEFTAPTGMVASSEDEALRLIDSLQRLGYDGLKIYSSINPAWVPAMVSRAHMHGMRVAGHIPAGMTAGRAISEGFDEVTHLNMIALNFFGDTVKTQTMARFKLVGEKAWTIDVNGKEMDAFLSLLREKNVTVDPTIGIFEALMTYLPGNIFASYKPIYDLLPTPLQRIVKSGNYIGEEKDTALYRQSYETLKKILSRMYRERIPIVIGTDGGILQHELEIMSEIGIPNNELLSMVTLKAAEVSHLANLYGSIEEGKIANMILVDGDPVTNIADLRNISTVFKRGRYYKPKEMYQYFGWGYRY